MLRGRSNEPWWKIQQRPIIGRLCNGNTLSPQIRVLKDQNRKKGFACIWFLGDELGIFDALGVHDGGFGIWHGIFGIRDSVFPIWDQLWRMIA